MMLPKLCLPTVSLPIELENALKKVLDAYPAKRLVSDGHVLYRHLLSRKSISRVQESKRRRGLLRTVPVNLWSDRQHHDNQETVESVLRYGSRETVAYAASRLHATYGSTLRILSEVAVRDPMFRPETMLDFGSGLGTAVWAAWGLWKDSLYEIQTVDTSREMGDMARHLRTGGRGEDERGEEGETIPGVYFRQYLPTSNTVKYDVVTSCYTLGDIQSHNIFNLSLTALWKKTKNYLVLVEMGNDIGFQKILEARDFVLDAPNWDTNSPPQDCCDTNSEDSLKGHVFAPCPHSHRCPLATEKADIPHTTVIKRPCHFGQRVALDFSNREALKHKGHNIEPFSYVILKKGPEDESPSREQFSRVLSPVKKRSRHVLTQQCCPDGEARQVIYTKSKHGSMYRLSRLSSWGELLPYDCKNHINNQPSKITETV